VWKQEGNNVKEIYTELCIGETRRGIGWWKTGVWKLKGIGRNTEQDLICSKEVDWSHILRCGGTEVWKVEILDNKYRNIDIEMGIRRTAGYNNKDQ
jgi:hypothetical protein